MNSGNLDVFKNHSATPCILEFHETHGVPTFIVALLLQPPRHVPECHIITIEVVCLNIN